MQKTFKYANEQLNSIKMLKRKHESFEQEFIRLAGQKSYDKTKQFYDDIISKLTEEISLLPTGYKYTGVFYIKSAYVTPTTFEKIEGSAFMRADLVSWQIEPTDSTKKQSYYGYYRAIYKESDLKAEITKADATPVYAEPKVATVDAL